MKVLLTGATGTLGSQVLFSMLEERFNDLTHLYLPVRKKQATSPMERVMSMLESAYAPEFIKQRIPDILEKTRVIPATDLLYPERFLNEGPVDYFIHSAGFVNLSTDDKAREEIFKENLGFTQSIFDCYATHIKKFIYISTAFSAGISEGLLGDNYLEHPPKGHRNHYEASKYAAERYILHEGKLRGMPIQILRPSVLGGNILKGPNFFISKYMVFYLFAKFFYKNRSGDKVRITAHEDTGLNIIPTDYAAKVITKVFDRPIEQLNIVHHTTTHIASGIKKIMSAVDFKHFNLTQQLIGQANGFESTLERFYYNTIGVHLTPYLTSKPCEWDTTVLQDILAIPDYNLEDYLENTIQFAKRHKFRNQLW